jgi:N,N'-diacetylchitobiose transport system substrate-binding protein
VKARILTAVGIAAALAVAGCSSSSNSGSSSGPTGSTTTSATSTAPSTGGASGGASGGADTSASGTLTVWLQTDAQTGWPDLVASTTAAFNQQYPNVKDDVQYQTWGDHLTKFDTQLAANSAPDVIEMGNTEMAKYMIDGAFADLTADKGKFDNSDNWLTGLADSAVLDGKVYGVPYYAGSRGISYRSDLWSAAGASTTPATIDDLISGCKAVQAKSTDKNFSAFYIPGKYWYMAMGFVYGNGGDIAKSDSSGKWTADLNSQEAQAGISKWVDLVKSCSKAPIDTDEAHPNQYTVMVKKQAAAIYDAGWVPGAIVAAPNDQGTGGDPSLKGKIATMTLPGFAAGKGMSTFLGGSDLAIPVSAKHKDWSEAWMKIFIDTDSEKALIKAGNLPNMTTLLDEAGANPTLKPFADAAKNSWFTPAAKNWVSVEKQNVLPDMLVSILNGQKSVDAATKAADSTIEGLLNGS